MRRSRKTPQHDAVVRTRRLCLPPRPAFVTLRVASPARFRRSRRRRRRASAGRERVVLLTERRQPCRARTDRFVGTHARRAAVAAVVWRVTSLRPSVPSHRRIGLTSPTPATSSTRRAASTSILDRAAVDLVDARRSCRRAPRAPSRPHRRAPTDVILTFSFVAALRHRAGSIRANTTTARAPPSRERVVVPDRAAVDLVDVRRSCRRAPRAPSRPHRRAPTDVILTFSSVAALPSPRLFTRTDTTTASERRAASTSFLVSAADLVERAPIVSSCAACAVLAAPPSADRRHPHVQLRCCSAYRRARSLELTRRRRASAETRARRSLIAPPTLSSARRSCRRAQRAPFWPHRRAPTDAILTFSFVAALPVVAPAHSSPHDDG